MKNKKPLLTILLFSLAAFFYSAELTDFSFESGIGFLNGIIIEDVWNSKVVTSGSSSTYTPTTRLSRLDWQLQNTPYFYFETSAAFNTHYVFNFGLKNAISRTCGIMEDYDWKITSQPDHLTNYSIHLLKLQTFYDIRANFGYKFFLNTKQTFSITPAFGLDFYSFDFYGVSGYRMYENEGWAKTFWKKDEIVIEYMHSYVAPRLSCVLDYDFTKHFEAVMEMGIAYKSQYDAFDYHENKSTYYDDRLQSAWAFDGAAKFYIKINSMNKLGLKATINYMPQVYAFTFFTHDLNDGFSKQPDSGTLGGTSRLLWSYAISYTFKF